MPLLLVLALLSWRPVDNLHNGFRVYWRTGAHPYTKERSRDVGKSTEITRNYNISVGQKICFTVRAYNRFGIGKQSREVCHKIKKGDL